MSWAWDPKDNDLVKVLADPASDRILAAAEDLGFQHAGDSGQCFQMENPYGAPFIQSFVFQGTGRLGGLVEELEILLAADAEQAEAMVVIDKRNRGFGGWVADSMGQDKRQLTFNLGHDQEFTPEDLEGIIREAVGM